MDRLKLEGWGMQEEEIPDIEKTKKMTKKETKKMTKKEIKKMTREELRVVFDTVDADKSGEVTRTVRKIYKTPLS